MWGHNSHLPVDHILTGSFMTAMSVSTLMTLMMFFSVRKLGREGAYSIVIVVFVVYGGVVVLDVAVIVIIFYDVVVVVFSKEVGARGGVPAVGLKLNDLVQRLQ